MEFKKYHSIENAYRELEINRWLYKYPELEMEKFIIQEKIHGSNFSIWFENLNNTILIKYGKRSGILGETEAFFNYQSVVNKSNIKLVVTKISEYMINNNIKNITLFGELYGNGVQKGVYYSEEKNIKFFDLLIDEQYVSPHNFIKIFKELGIEDNLVPILAEDLTLKEALNFNIEFNSTIPSEKIFSDLENISEGVVIKPQYNVYTFNEDQGIFYLKKKNIKFSEKNSKNRSNKIEKNISSEVESTKKLFLEYINQNRLNNLFSKYGNIQDKAEIGKYNKLLLEDAKEDFFKDHKNEFIQLSDSDKKYVLKIGQEITKLIMENL